MQHVAHAARSTCAKAKFCSWSYVCWQVHYVIYDYYFQNFDIKAYISGIARSYALCYVMKEEEIIKHIQPGLILW